jgi:hypothetical protein
LTSFLIWIPFISFSCFIVLFWVRMGREDIHPYLVPDFRGNDFSFSPLMMLTIGVSCIVFITLTYIPFFPIFFRAFLWKDVEFCQWLFCINWDDHVISVLDSV